MGVLFLPSKILPLKVTCLTASPSFHTWGDFPSIWLQAEYSTMSKSATLLNFGWSFWFGSQKCSISAMVNSLWKTINNTYQIPSSFYLRKSLGLLNIEEFIFSLSKSYVRLNNMKTDSSNFEIKEFYKIIKSKWG